MTTKPESSLYCARVKTQDGYVLTKTLPLNQLVDLCKDSLAVDIIYSVEIGANGGLRSTPIGFFSVVFNKLDGEDYDKDAASSEEDIQRGVIGEDRTEAEAERKEATSTSRDSGVVTGKGTRSVSRSNRKSRKKRVVKATTLSEARKQLLAADAGEIEIIED